MDDTAKLSAAPRAPWIKAIITGALTQVLLFAIYIPLAAQGASENLLFTSVVIMSLLFYLAGGYLAARSARQSHVKIGVVVGLAGVALYYCYVAYLVSTGAMNATGTRPVTFVEALAPMNLADHGLKVVMAVLGAWFAGRRAQN